MINLGYINLLKNHSSTERLVFRKKYFIYRLTSFSSSRINHGYDPFPCLLYSKSDVSKV